MTGARWKRWVLGGVVAGIIPVAIGGAGCSGQDDSPEASAGTPSTSGSGSGGSSAGSNSAGSATAGTTAASGTSAGGSAAGSSAAGASAGGSSAAGSSPGGSSPGGAHSNGGSGGTNTCCTQGSADICTEDGQQLRRCALVPGKTCDGATSMYVSVWQLQACPNGCGSAGGSGPRCN